MRILAKLITMPLIASGFINAASANDIHKSCTKPLTIGEFGVESNLKIVINEGVATLSGYAGSETNSQHAERIALCIDGVDVVENNSNYD